MQLGEQIECLLVAGGRLQASRSSFSNKSTRKRAQTRAGPLESERIKSRLEAIACSQLLLALGLLLALTGSGEGLIQVPNRHTVASIPGDLVLGILVPVHERPSPKQAQTRTCGAVREQYGIQRVEAAFRTIDSINADPNILPNITLGIEIRDTCWHSPIALEQSIEFIRDAMAASEQPQQQVATLAGSARHPQRPMGHSSSGGGQAPVEASQQVASINSTSAAICAPYLKQQQQQLTGQKKIKNLVGVVGPASSGDTVQVQNLLQLFNMPQVGYSATSRDLSNKNFFKYFLRVVPSDKLQAQVLIDLMMAHNWTYITVVYTEGSYGSSLMNAFRERAQEVGICFSTLESMPPNADDGKFDELIEAIRNHQNARVVICMCEGRTIGRLFAGFKRQNISNEYLIVGSDGWSDRFDVVDKQEEIALGGISIRIHSAYVHDFDDYYFSLNPFMNHRNPWFAEFWEQRFQCNLEYPATTSGQQQQQQQHLAHNQQQQHANRPAFIRPANAKVYNRTCSGKESLRQNHKQDAKMAFVQKSIISMALGLDSMQRTICGRNRPGLCPEMLPVNGSIFLQHLMNVSFSFLNEEVYFDEQGDPPGKYEILNFQRKKRSIPPPNDSELDFDSTSSGLVGTGSSVESDRDESYEMFAHGDYSSASEQAAGKHPNRPQGGKKSTKKLQKGLERRPASYDSYSTLRVYSTSDNRTGVSESALGPQPRRRVQRRRRQAIAPTQPSDYSATSDYEYVLVGSWKSTDGLSLFGKVHWPARSWLFNQHHFAAGNSAGSSSTLSGGGLAGTSSNGINGGGGGGSDAQDLATTLRPRVPFEQQQQPAGGNGSLTAPPLPVEAYEPYESDDDIPPPKSLCSLPCAKGHAKKIQSDSVKCCWVCVPCRPREYLFNEFKCKACDKGWWPNVDQTGCDQIPIEYLDWRSLEALVSIAIALFGLLLTLLTALVFIKHNDTPVVKSTTRELSYMILFAMLLCYTNTFFLVTKPSKLACFVSRCLPGASFAMMYGALVTKTNRIARILAGSKKKIITRRPHFMSATAQLTITWLIVAVECVIIVAMLIKEPADRTHEYPSDERVLLVCNTTTMGVIAPLGFDFFLIAMCTLYALKTRNVPENFNEAKFIGFTMYTTLVIWVAFVVIYLSSEHKVTTLCLCISFSALFALFLLFFPRCYIILFKPEKNNRSYFTTIKNVRCHIGYQMPNSQPSTNSSGGGAGALNHSSLNGSSKLSATLHHQFQFQASAGSLTSSPKTIAGSHLAGAAKRPLLSSGLFEPASRRSPTSGHQVAPAAGLADERNELMTGACADLDAALADRKHRERQLNLQRLADERAGGQPPDCSLGSLRFASAKLGAPTEMGVSEDKPAGAGSSPDELLPAGHQQQQQQQQADSNGAPNGHLRQLCAHIRWAFARRSRRKESDKTAIIQQHLRAIRHAENLDRQTHFRRSQVQRLVQRFDSNVPFSGATPSTGQNGNGQQPFAVQQFSEFMGEQRDKRLAELLEGQEAARLLAAMSQLIGHDNLLRLAQVLARFHEQQLRQQVRERQLELATSELPCFDLRKQVDRRLALAWLSFLAQLTQKAMESVQMVAASVHARSWPPAELLLSPQALPLSEPLKVSDTAAADNLATDSAQVGGGQGSLQMVELRARVARRNEYSNVTQASGNIDNERAAEAPQRASDKLSLGSRPTANCQRNSNMSPALELDLVNLKSNLGGGARGSGALELEEAEDPIRRALERITGKSTTTTTSTTAAAAAQATSSGASARSARRLGKGTSPRPVSEEERDAETRLRLEAATGQLEVAPADCDQQQQKQQATRAPCSPSSGAIYDCCCSSSRRRTPSGERARRSRCLETCSMLARDEEAGAVAQSSATIDGSQHELARRPACCSAAPRRHRFCRRKCACCSCSCSGSRSRSGQRQQQEPDSRDNQSAGQKANSRPVSSGARIETRPPADGRRRELSGQAGDNNLQLTAPRRRAGGARNSASGQPAG